METGEPQAGADIVVAGPPERCEVPGCDRVTTSAIYDGEHLRYVCGEHREAVRLGFVLAGGLADAA